MANKGLVCLLLISSLTVCQSDQSNSRFWDYFSHFMNGKIGWNLQENSVREDSGIKSSLHNGVSYVGKLFGPLQTNFQKQVYEDSDGLRRLIRRELQEVQRKIYPYMDEAHQKISKNLEKLQNRLSPYSEELKYQVRKGAQQLKTQLGLYKDDFSKGATQNVAENIKDQIFLHTMKVRQTLHPLREKLLAEIHYAAEELHGNLSPHALTSQEKLTLHVQELSNKLSQNAKELHKKIHKNLDDLKDHLVSYPQKIRERFPETQAAEPVGPYVEEVAAQVQREVEEFNRNTQMQIEHFTWTINMEMEELNYRLSPASSNLQDTVSSIQEVQEKLESLWKDISQNL
ncbi:apolipoprotein A-V [Rana temporaria]|uniref:apolipoprotein A-V n=1 Tax=Rana temporaria TaxID=8407 RepID=UPI001AADE76D|nr:apolipoprotein A-V [Rana temporaria]